MTNPVKPTATDYLLAHPSDRDRLYVQFDLYHERFLAAFRRAVDRAGIDPSSTWRALDVACGEGLYAADLADRYPGVEVVGVDRDPDAISTAQSAFADRSRIRFHLADVHEPLPEAVGTGFDVAFVQFGLTHFRHGVVALRQICNVLRPGGAILLLDATERSFEYPHPSVKQFADAIRAAWRGFGTYAAGDRYLELLGEAGFVDVATEPQNYVMGGATPAGIACLRNMLELFVSMRTALVERARVISAQDFDEQLEQLRGAAGPNLEGTCFYQTAIARKPI